MKTKHLITCFFFSTILGACDSSDSGNGLDADESSAIVENQSALVSAVEFSGESGNYTFSVTVESPDTGCSQYADWWEVFTPDGTLIYRRILTHSHVDEQPFTRSGGPVPVAASEEIIIRAHMNNLGYGTQVFSGSIAQGLTSNEVTNTFAPELELAQPLPDSCAF